MTDFWAVEFHAHSCASPDGWHRPEEIALRAQKAGLTRLFLTDHNRIHGAQAGRDAHPDLVMVGEEVLTTEGELLGYFVRERVPAGLAPLEAASRLKDQGALIALAHPTDTRRAYWRKETIRSLLPYLDAVEVFNARVWSQRAIRAAHALAEEFHLLKIVGSDAHTLWEVGLCKVWLPPFEDAASLREALAHPGVRFETRRAPLWAPLLSRWAYMRFKRGRPRCPEWVQKIPRQG